MATDSAVISKVTIKRLVCDIKELKKKPLTEHGIHYVHDEDDILKGYALIIGPKNTPYEGGYYVFKFNFPTNYPHSPPVVEYLTNDGATRFNPNLYINGKVCISILNTWHGEPWSGCQTISSTLLSICSVLNETPLTNEPGINKLHPDYMTYNEIIRYKNFEVAMCAVLKSKVIQTMCPTLFNIIVNDFIENFDIKIELLYKSSDLFNKFLKTTHVNSSSFGVTLRTNIYTMNCLVDYNSIANIMNETKDYVNENILPHI